MKAFLSYLFLFFSLNLSFAKDFNIVDSQLRLENFLDHKFYKLSEAILEDIKFELSTQVKLNELKAADFKSQSFKPTSIALLPNPKQLKDKFENDNLTGFNISSITVNLLVGTKKKINENIKKELTSRFVAHVGMPVNLIITSELESSVNLNSNSHLSNNLSVDTLKASQITKRSHLEDFILNYQALIGCLFLTLIYLIVQLVKKKKKSVEEHSQPQNISPDTADSTNKLTNLNSQKMSELSTPFPAAESVGKTSEILQKITNNEETHKTIQKEFNLVKNAQSTELKKLEDTLSMLANLIEKSSLVSNAANEDSVKQYFSYLKPIPSQTLMLELSSLDNKDVTSVLSFFDVQKIKECFAFASPVLKKEIIECVMNGKLLSIEEISELDNKLKNIPSLSDLINDAQTIERSMGVLNLFIEALPPNEEIELIARYKSNVDEVHLKEYVFSLGMLPDWSKEHLSGFAKTLSISEIKSILFIFPKLKELFLENMGRFDRQALLVELDKTQKEVKYELESLQSVRKHMKEYIEQNKINLKQIYQ